MKNVILALAMVLGLASAVFAQPNYRSQVEQLAAQYPEAFACAHARPQRDCNWDFATIVAIELNKLDPAVGANRKRGTGDFSEDALAIKSPSGDTTDVAGGRSYVIDYIVCAGGSPTCSPSVGWTSVGGVSGWVDPRTLKDPRGSAPSPAPSPAPAPTDVTQVIARLTALEEAIMGLQGELTDREYVIANIEQFKLELANIAAQNAMLISILNEINAKLAEPMEFKGSLLGIPITLRKQ